MKRFDVVIVGAGLAGATLAHLFHKDGANVLIVEKRNHIAGNCFDRFDEHGVMIHQYGPHYFRTNYPEVKKFLSQFTSWIPQRYKVRVSINKKLYSFPINRNTLNEYFNLELKTAKQAEKFLASKRLPITNPQNAEEQILAHAGREIYEAFFKNYTRKQWGMDPKKLGAEVTARIPIRTDTNDDYTSAAFQALPKLGYTEMVRKMIDGIPLMLQADFEALKEHLSYKTLIYTGPIDTYFNNRYGPLPYRSLEFKFKTFEKDFYQDWLQINYPNEHRYTRIVELKHITKQKTPFTTISIEYPQDKGDPYYPIPNRDNNQRYQQYQVDALKLKNVYFIGRLAQYQYLNMDQVVKAALDLYKDIHGKKNS